MILIVALINFGMIECSSPGFKNAFHDLTQTCILTVFQSFPRKNQDPIINPDWVRSIGNGIPLFVWVRYVCSFLHANAKTWLRSFWLLFGNGEECANNGGRKCSLYRKQGCKICCFSIYVVALINCGIIECSSPGFKNAFQIRLNCVVCRIQNEGEVTCWATFTKLLTSKFPLIQILPTHQYKVFYEILVQKWLIWECKMHLTTVHCITALRIKVSQV